MKMTYERFCNTHKRQLENISNHLGPVTTGDFLSRRLEIISLINGNYLPNEDPDLGKIHITEHNLSLFLLKWS